MLSIKDVVIDPELKDYLRNLKLDEREALVESVKKDGFTDPLVIWLNHGILVDGHNRHSVWQDEFGSDPDKAPEIVEKHFADKDAVKEYMARKQLGRRNLSDAERVKFALLLKPVLAKEAETNLHLAKGKGVKGVQNSAQVKTVDKIAKTAGVSRDTVQKVEKVLKAGSDKVKKDMLAGDLSINKAHETVNPKKSKPSPPEEPKQDKRTEFDPTKFDPSMKSDSEPVDSSKLIVKCDQLVLSTESKLAASFEELKRAIRAIDDANEAKLVPNHKSILGHYDRLFGEMENATATMMQFTRSWKFRK